MSSSAWPSRGDHPRPDPPPGAGAVPQAAGCGRPDQSSSPGTPRPTGEVERLLVGANAAVSLIGILFERRGGDFDRLQARLPGEIGAAAARQGVERVVHVSAIGADPASPAAYARTKAAGEAALRASFPQATILRPSIVFGPEDGFFNRFARMSQLRRCCR